MYRRHLWKYKRKGDKENEYNFHGLPSDFLTRCFWVKAVRESEYGLRKGIRFIGDSSAICSVHFRKKVVTPQQTGRGF